ncbi:MAG: UDP-3-O-[3-hydroxymyristoyl] glucosamine N-acyltransferase [Parvicella sp.]|jgi:UDP-3-O-[3-hydroxymyristoyl] glucosamine N-acyltransferase
MPTLFELANTCGGHVNKADENYLITEAASLEGASNSSIAPFFSRKYALQLEHSQAGAVLCSKRPEGYDGRVIEVKNPQLALTQLMAVLYPVSSPNFGIHSSAVIAKGVNVPEDCEIGPNVVIERGAKIASGVRIMAGSYIGEAVTIGINSSIGPNSTIRAHCELGQGVTISSGVVIGSDGFGYVPDAEHGASYWAKIMHVGKVIIGNKVEIGANSTVDRGSISNTVIADDVIIDNLVQVAHNVTIGRATAIAALSGIAGSTVIGEECLIGGRVAIMGHLNICDKTIIYADSLVTKSIPKAGIYSSSLPAQPLKKWHRTIATLRRHGLEKRSHKQDK